MNNFSINTDFKALDFDNKILGFDKVQNNNLNDSKDVLKADLKFDEVFNSFNQAPVDANLSIDTGENKKISPTEKTMNDIGNGFNKSLNDLNDIQAKSERDFETFASGGDISVHDVMISSQKASLSMQMAIQLRNRILSAYNDFKTMSV